MSLFGRKQGTRHSAPTAADPATVLAVSEWLAWPTLRESNTERPVVGTSHYQDTIEVAANGRTASGPKTSLLMAELRTIRTGDYAGGIEVHLGGALVGHLPQTRSSEYQPVLADLEGAGVRATCRAVIVGGHYEPDDQGWRYFGVALLQPAKPAPFDPSRDPFLPPFVGQRVDVRSGHDDLFARILNSKAKSKRVAVLGRLTHDSRDWQVAIDGDAVGALDAEYLDDTRLREAEAAGFPLTCQLRVIREPDRPLRVAADLP
jgi:hypothetical protein